MGTREHVIRWRFPFTKIRGSKWRVWCGQLFLCVCSEYLPLFCEFSSDLSFIVDTALLYRSGNCVFLAFLDFTWQNTLSGWWGWILWWWWWARKAPLDMFPSWTPTKLTNTLPPPQCHGWSSALIVELPSLRPPWNPVVTDIFKQIKSYRRKLIER